MDFIAIDGQNNIASAVSTSGIALHYPGRVGDSPIIGAGNYADTRHGACAFTGRGEMSIRTATAHTVVTHMRAGMSSLEACHEAAKDLKNLDDAYRGATSFIAVDRHGNHAACPIAMLLMSTRTSLWQSSLKSRGPESTLETDQPEEVAPGRITALCRIKKAEAPRSTSAFNSILDLAPC